MRHKIFIAIFLMVIIVGVGSCFMMRSNEHKTHPLYAQFSQLRKDLPALDFTSLPTSTPVMESYRKFYQLDFPGIEHRWGTFESGEYILAAHIFTPSNPKGTMFVLHGYLDHTGMLYRIIQNCLEQGFVVAVYDLPGHGLSSGERAAIRDFSDYVSVFHDFLELSREHVPAPYHVLSHSTGGAIAFEFLATTPEQIFEKIVFLAPLVHHAHWLPAKIGYTLGKPLQIHSLPRRYSQDNIDPALAEFIKTDPLQTGSVPTSWVGELYEWNQEIQETAKIASPALVIQGKQDDVVDWEYNIPFLQEKIPHAQVKLIENAGHYLINESPEIQAEIFHTLDTYLKKSEINFSQN